MSGPRRKPWISGPEEILRHGLALQGANERDCSAEGVCSRTDVRSHVLASVRLRGTAELGRSVAGIWRRRAVGARRPAKSLSQTSALAPHETRRSLLEKRLDALAVIFGLE